MKVFLQELCKGNWEYVFRLPKLRKKMFPIMNFYRPHLDTLEIQVCSHCNLNCKGCASVSPLAEEAFVDVCQLEKDVKELAKKLTIRAISIDGGEALLYPKIDKILYVVRNAFSKTQLVLLSNGLLIFKMPDSFWRALKECDVWFSVTIYPPFKNKAPEMFQYVRTKGVKVYKDDGYHDGYDMNKDWRKCLYSPNKTYGTAEEQYKKCDMKVCVLLYESHLYHCPMFYWKYYNRYFHEEHELIKGCNIYQHSGWELMKAMTSPMPQCAHCKLPWEKDTWDYSKREKSEWVEE